MATCERSEFRERPVKRSLRKSSKTKQTKHGLSERSELRERVSLTQSSHIKQIKQIRHDLCERSELRKPSVVYVKSSKVSISGMVRAKDASSASQGQSSSRTLSHNAERNADNPKSCFKISQNRICISLKYICNLFMRVKSFMSLKVWSNLGLPKKISKSPG